MSYLRKPFVAGQFYERQPAILKKQVEKYIRSDIPKIDAKAVISPHAGLIYSGSVAGAVYSSIHFPDTFVILGPNHTGLGSPVSVFNSGVWETPLHNFEVDEIVANEILSRCDYCVSDVNAHLFEHSIEVQLPFIGYFSETVKIVPICIMRASIAQCKEIGDALAGVIKGQAKKIVVVASSDMSHYVDDNTARTLDSQAIRQILNMSPEGLYSVVSAMNISMCGVIPTVITLYTSLLLGAKDAKLVKYATSAEVSGDYKHVVGYSGILIS